LCVEDPGGVAEDGEEEEKEEEEAPAHGFWNWWLIGGYVGVDRVNSGSRLLSTVFLDDWLSITLRGMHK
jgi:hypothetical protein